MTQPDKLHLHEFHHPLWKHVHPLLSAMEQKFWDLSQEVDLLLTSFNAADPTIMNSSRTCDESKTRSNYQSQHLLTEITDSIRLLALRAKQVRMLYQSKGTFTSAETRYNWFLLQYFDMNPLLAD